MKILAIGDIVGTKTIPYINEHIWKIREKHRIDFVVANGENATDIHGISRPDAESLLDCGIDLITLGNHTYGRRDICTLLSDSQNIIRPANYPPEAPGGGYTILNVQGWRVLCINIQGTALMESLACPFATVDGILRREKGEYDLSLMDIHAEATSEKLALARYFDGRINVMFGTHTHVTTADEQILPHGSGYITDIGMSGPIDGIIGSSAAEVIERFRTKMPVHFKPADGEIKVNGTIFTLDTDKKRVTEVKRIIF